MNEMKMRMDIAMEKSGEERAQALLHLIQTYNMSIEQRVGAVLEIGKVYLALGKYDEAHHCFHEAVHHDPTRISEIQRLVLQVAKAETNLAKSLALQAGLLAYVSDVSHYDAVVESSFKLHLPQVAERAWRIFRHSHDYLEDYLFELEAESHGYEIHTSRVFPDEYDAVPIPLCKGIPDEKKERIKGKLTAAIERRVANNIPEDIFYFQRVLGELEALNYGATDEEKQVKSSIILRYVILSDAVSHEDYKAAVAVCKGNTGNLVLIAMYAVMQRDETYKKGIVAANKNYLKGQDNPSPASQIWADLFDIPVPALATKSREYKMLMALGELERISKQPETVVNIGYARMIQDYITKLTQVR
jgi:tetratricopeptide (TPR) repeat protein